MGTQTIGAARRGALLMDKPHIYWSGGVCRVNTEYRIGPDLYSTRRRNRLALKFVGRTRLCP